MVDWLKWEATDWIICLPLGVTQCKTYLCFQQENVNVTKWVV